MPARSKVEIPPRAESYRISIRFRIRSESDPNPNPNRADADAARPSPPGPNAQLLALRYDRNERLKIRRDSQSAPIENPTV